MGTKQQKILYLKKKGRVYNGNILSKKEGEWVNWYQRGENQWQNAFYQYQGRRKGIRDEKMAKTWFNKVLKTLHKKGLFLNVPFAFISDNLMYWAHPGFENSGYKAEVGVESSVDLLTYQKPIL